MEKTIELLNKALADKLTAIHQYMYFHFHFNDHGLSLMADLFKKTAIEEMKHLEKLAERILFLKGDIDLASSGKIKKITKLEDMLSIAQEMEIESALRYNEYLKECTLKSDSISRQLFEEFIIDEERHADRFGTEIKSIQDMEDSYLAIC